MSHITSIDFQFKDEADAFGLYGKDVQETCCFEDTLAERICLSQNNGTDELFEENLWLFSRTDECNHRFSVGFFMDQDDNLRPINETAFCFFPTKEVTGLKFIIHAPFLLTDSREGIRAGVPHNDTMLQKLAALSADAMVYLRDIGEQKKKRLIDDRIVRIIPIDGEQFSNPSDKRKVSFRPFYDYIKKKFASERLLPSTDGYVETKNAYWASVSQLTQLLSNEQLADIVENEKAKWVFVSLSRDEVQRNNKALSSYLDELVRTNINEDFIIGGRSKWGNMGISADFLEAQSFEWLHRFYKWLSETKHRTEEATNKPFFLNQEGNATAAYDKDRHLILFLPANDVSGYQVVHPELLKNSNTMNFIKQIGIKEPSLKDQIYNAILPMYRNGIAIDTRPHFKLFFKYFCECSNTEVDSFISLIKDYEFVIYHTGTDAKTYRGTPSSMYFPTPELTSFLETKKDVRFIALEEYKKITNSSQEEELLMAFFVKLGVQNKPRLFDKEIDYREGLPKPYSSRGTSWKEATIEGCKEIIEYIVSNKDAAKSLVLWNCLLKVIETNFFYCKGLEPFLQGKCHYFYYQPRCEHFISSDGIMLKESNWIVNSNGEFVSSKKITTRTLSKQYDTSSDAAKTLLKFLGIVDDTIMEEEKNNDANLTDVQREQIEFAKELSEFGFSKDEIRNVLREHKRQKDARKLASEQSASISEGTDSSTASRTTIGNDSEDDDYLSELDDEDEDISVSNQEKPKLEKIKKSVVKDIVQRTKKRTPASAKSVQNKDEELAIDQDEYIPAPVDYSKRIEKAKQESAAEIGRIAYFEELQTKAIELPKYTYGWFKVLLEMESINCDEANSNSKQISISFAKVERETGTQRTLVLKHPDRYIPQFMEDLADIPLVLHMGNQAKTVAIDVANIKSYTLRVKMKNGADVEGIDLSSVTSATIDAKSPAFLIEELRKRFSELGIGRNFQNDFDMKGNLCGNIDFIFGPPGTGKTTHLAKNVLIPLMQNNSDCKVLVLTPTNKSADVLVSRIMKVSQDTSYCDWLGRFGATSDEEIEQSPIFRDKTFDIRLLRRNVTVTTIARFSYDFFMPEDERIFLNGINWDDIVIDEASMIPITNIVYPLYKKTPRKFIIAGDPFQIEPITTVDIWKNENIFTMVKLDSFTNPKTEPHQYKVELLTTQYRSIPDIGYVFSNFAYGGILKHYRKADSQLPLNLSNKLGAKTLNVIKFPVSKYESIYRCKRLQQRSSYQVYSALFTFEYVCYFSNILADNNPGKHFSIGVIAPYRAQADIIDKLLASVILPKEIDVQIGTIHGFQGDECDIIFAVFNPPPTISASREMFLNKKNIINVSISRARDYLFVVMPDDSTENIDNLRLVKRVEQLMRDTGSWKVFLSPDIEELMFGDKNYLENNAFSTGHQSVNVYGFPEKSYEIRAEDTAVDIQIHKTT